MITSLVSSPAGTAFALTSDGKILERRGDSEIRQAPGPAPLVLVELPGPPGIKVISLAPLQHGGMLALGSDGSLFERYNDPHAMTGQKFLWREVSTNG